MKVLRGIGASTGVAIGKAFFVERGPLRVPRKKIPSAKVEEEVARLSAAMQGAAKQLEEVRDKLSKSGTLGEHSYLLDVQNMILEDKAFSEQCPEMIREERINAEWALEKSLKALKAAFEKVRDSYLRERSNDVEHVGMRIMRRLMGFPKEEPCLPPEGAIVVAHDLSPVDTLRFDRSRILGFALDMGGKTSHTAILARSLNLPAVVGLETITKETRPGDELIVDGVEGTVVIRPSESKKEAYRRKGEVYRRVQDSLLEERDLPCATQDGVEIQIAANIELLEELDLLESYGAKGIGLLRTEFLYIGRRRMPTEDEQVDFYLRAAEKSPGPTTIRTIDLGGDKFLSPVKLPGLRDSGFGLRGIRLCLKEREIFKTQLRAILRAAGKNNGIRVMFPLVSGMEELRDAIDLLEEAKGELVAEGFHPAEKIEVGCMIEVPSAALISDFIASEVDFLSVGTNDLIQYAVGIDRADEHVSYLYRPLHPAILRMLKYVVDSAKSKGKPVSICGEMAGDPMYTLILLGLGFRELSMNPLSIPRVRRVIRKADVEEADHLLDRAMMCHTAGEAEKIVSEHMTKRFPKVFMQP